MLSAGVWSVALPDDEVSGPFALLWAGYSDDDPSFYSGQHSRW